MELESMGCYLAQANHVESALYQTFNCKRAKLSHRREPTTQVLLHQQSKIKKPPTALRTRRDTVIDPFTVHYLALAPHHLFPAPR